METRNKLYIIPINKNVVLFISYMLKYSHDVNGCLIAIHYPAQCMLEGYKTMYFSLLKTLKQ